MSHNHKALSVWTLRHRERGNVVTVALPEGFIPDSEWEMTGECIQSLHPRHDSTDEEPDL